MKWHSITKMQEPSAASARQRTGRSAIELICAISTDLRDLHIRNAGGQRVEVGIRKSAYDQREDYDNRHGQRQDGFWR